MPTWPKILAEHKRLREGKKDIQPFDPIRRKYLAELNKHTKRNTILYASNWTQEKDIPPGLLSINLEDIQGFMTAVHRLRGKHLDLILHSPGGSPEAVEALVSYLRQKFNDIRVIVPHGAMSAATMLACAADRIVMGKQSFLGPIDPQFIIDTQIGRQAVPAQAILQQFEQAKKDCQDPSLLGTWLPILPQYGPALLAQSENASILSKELVSEWLASYMFAGDSQASQKASKIADSLSSHELFMSHKRPISRAKAREFGLQIEDLEADQKLQDLVLSVYHSVTITFDGTPAVKIIENHKGIAFVKRFQQLLIGAQAPPSPEEGKQLFSPSPPPSGLP